MPRNLGIFVLALVIVTIATIAVKTDVRNSTERIMNISRDTTGQEAEKIIDIYNAWTGQVEKVRTVVRSDAEWKKLLTPEQYQITRLKGTEPAWSGHLPLPAHDEVGVYECVGCGTDLFAHDRKFESGTGWPSFTEPISPLNVRLVHDSTAGMERTEVVCARCGAHLGHVFDDGPPPAGKRYCMNAAALKLSAHPRGYRLEVATFAAGCFWGVEAAFREYLNKGVVSTRVGYTGGDFPNPTYEQVSSHKTGHYESVEVAFDPKKISYGQLLDIFWRRHNPTRSDGQGPDIGPQYRGAIFYHSEEQRAQAEESKKRLEQLKHYDRPIVTSILPAKVFWPAEDYHQQYYEKNGVSGLCPVY
jgi:peptide methionine sulfoxide reductase msrA/msrB